MGVFCAAGESGMIARSDDGGDTWVSVGPGDPSPEATPPGYTIEFEHIETDGAGTWIACSQYTGLWRSIDDGETWNIVAGTYTANSGTSIRWQWVCFAGDDTWIASFFNQTHVYRSTDGGATWASVEHGDAYPSPRNMGQIVADRTTGIVWATALTNKYGRRSTDRGATWETVDNDPDNYANQVHLSFQNGQFIGASNGTIYTSPTAATGTWTLHAPTVPDNGAMGNFVWDASLGEYWGFDLGGEGMIRRADDIDLVWDFLAPVGSNRNPKGVATDGAGTIIYCGYTSSGAITGLYRANADMTMDPLTPPAGHTDDYLTVAYGAGVVVPTARTTAEFF